MKLPWFRSSNRTWYCTVGRKQIPLGRDEHGANRKDPPPAILEEYYRVMGGKVPKPDSVTLGELVELYSSRVTSINPKVVRDIKYRINKFMDFVGASVKVADLRPFHLSDWVRANPGWSESSKRGYTDKVLNMLSWAVRQGYIDRDPITSTKGFKRLGRYEKARRYIPDELAERLIAAARPELKACLIVLRETGMRPIEVCRAQVEKYDKEAGTLTVPNKTAHATGMGERTVWLSEAARAVVEERIGYRLSGPVFRTRWLQPWTPSYMAQKFRDLKLELGVDMKKYGLYGFRHGFVSNAINKSNVNPALVAQLSGHTNLQTLLKFYLEQDPEALKAAIEAINKRPT